MTSQNRTLAESDHNGVEVHLFEVLHPTQYIYLGVVSLAGEPYQEDQADEDGVIRKVWMFPVKPVTPISIDSTAYQSYTEAQQKRAEKLSDAALSPPLLQQDLCGSLIELHPSFWKKQELLLYIKSGPRQGDQFSLA